MSRTLVLCLTLTIGYTLLASCFGKEQNEGSKSDSKSLDLKGMSDSASSKVDTKALADSDPMSKEKDDVDLMGVMTMCNESFRIEMSYLISLNESGSFPDETDKTPKCYLRCVLQSLEIASMDDGAIDPERAATIFAGERNGEPMSDILEFTTTCAKGRDEKCKCEMAYNFLKCLFSAEIEKYTTSKP